MAATQRDYQAMGRGYIKAAGGVFTLLAVTALLCGCVTSDEQKLAELIAKQMKELETPAPVSNGYNVPESPSPSLRPLSAGNGTIRPDLHSPRTRGKITVQPESILGITVEEDPTLTGSYEVNQSSSIQFKYIGLVFLPNMTAEEASAVIESTLRDRGFRSATVTVKITKASYDTVRVTGAVMESSNLKIGPGSSVKLGEALRRAGGIRTQAKGARIKIVREGLLSPIGLANEGEEYVLLNRNGDPEVPDVAIANNDWVHVFGGSEAGAGEKHVYVLGEVGKPGIITFSGNESCSMLHLMFKLGGLPKWADSRHVELIRRDEKGEETTTKVDVSKLLESGNPEDDVKLENGDRVIVRERRLIF
jgi:protein involved in polysaccharide export with SLBB domain